MNILSPASYIELLASAKAATCLTYFRHSGGCDITIDDIPNDRRTRIVMYASSGQHGAVQIRTLCKFDARKKYWSKYCQPECWIEFKHRRGEKAFHKYMRELALQNDNVIAEIVSWYRK